jgi:hypothetical protein
MQDHREVSPLAREGMSSVGGLTFYPLNYGAAFACSLIPPPLCHRLTLARSFPLLLGVRGEENSGVATFHRCTRVGRVASLRR